MPSSNFMQEETVSASSEEAQEKPDRKLGVDTLFCCHCGGFVTHLMDEEGHWICVICREIFSEEEENARND